jgi:uncharacterized phage-associated protein
LIVQLSLVYLAHGFVLGALDRSLIQDDVLAWKYGPVIRSVYVALPSGPQKITDNLGDFSPAEFEEDEKNIVDQVFEKYGRYSGIDLSKFTHREGTPWKEVWDLYGQNAVIPRDRIRDYFQGLISRG